MKIARIARSLAFAAVALMLSLPPALAQGSGGQTTLKVYNASNNPVTVWLTLNGYGGSNPGFYSNVSSIPFKPQTTINAVNPLQGSFTLGAGKMVSVTPPVGTGIAGNFSFGNAPNNCRTPADPNGQNLAEFTLDNNTPAFSPAYTQEAIDISCVNGVNAKLQFDLTKTSGAGSWQTAGQSNVTTFANTKFTPPPSSNINLVGVFPVGCDNCTSQANPGCNPQWVPWNVGSTTALCNVQRPASQSGGTVMITFKGFYPVAASQTKIPN